MTRIRIRGMLDSKIPFNHSNPCQWVIIFLVNGDWPSGKALGSGPRIGVRNAKKAFRKASFT